MTDWHADTHRQHGHVICSPTSLSVMIPSLLLFCHEDANTVHEFGGMTIHRWVWIGGSASHISPPPLATSPPERATDRFGLPPFLPSHFGGHFAEAGAFRVQWTPTL